MDADIIYTADLCIIPNSLTVKEHNSIDEYGYCIYNLSGTQVCVEVMLTNAKATQHGVELDLFEGCDSVMNGDLNIIWKLDKAHRTNSFIPVEVIHGKVEVMK